MCGLLGFMGDGFRLDPSRSLTLLERRGPDDSGQWQSGTPGGSLWLGHTRLAILDLSAAGHQPMIDPETGNVVIFNGEIYNYRQLRRPLLEKGYRFQSDSDTEVILALFAEHGISFVQQLRGMFALALWENRPQRLWLIRDRLGIKPLYYYRGPEGLAFGSECRAVRDLMPARAWDLSHQGLSSYLKFGSVSEPYTLWEGLRTLPAAAYASWDGRHWLETRYWNPSLNPELAITEREALGEIKRLLEESVALRTVSDVPLGVFLSGGIDSSIVAAVLSGLSSETKTFTVACPAFGYDESNYANLVARRFSTHHQVVTLSSREVTEAVPQAVQCQDQPSVDGINTWIISKAARGAGLTVALSGLGGDELFFGYDLFRQIKAWRARRWKVLEPMIHLLPVFREDRLGRLREIVWSAKDEEAFSWMRAFWSPGQLREMGYISPAPAEEGETGGSFENRFSWHELRGYMKNTLLRDADVMSMSHGLELRVPFIDHLLVELVLRLPPALKWGNYEQKYLLVKAMEDLLPGQILARRKSGFTLPFDRWLLSELREPVAASLRQLERSGIFPKDFVTGQWQDFLKGKQHWIRLWQLYIISHHLSGDH